MFNLRVFVACLSSLTLALSCSSEKIRDSTGVEQSNATGGTDVVGENAQTASAAASEVLSQVRSCAELVKFKNTRLDAAVPLQRCIDQSPSGSTLLIPPGRYNISTGLVVKKSMVIGTEGAAAKPACRSHSYEHCAELFVSPDLNIPGPLFLLNADNITIDHIAINGNKDGRWNTPSMIECVRGNTSYGMLVSATADNFRFVNSLAINALCSQALHISPGPGSDLITQHGVEVLYSEISYNGNSDIKYNDGGVWREGLWADGITVHHLTGGKIIGNVFIDNTDVTLILGGCVNCLISDNGFRHAQHRSGSFAEIMLHKWVQSSGFYEGTLVANNRIDCDQAICDCGFGILVGTRPWYYGANLDDANGRNSLRIMHNRIFNTKRAGLVVSNGYHLTVGPNEIGPRKDEYVQCAGRPFLQSDYSIGRVVWQDIDPRLICTYVPNAIPNRVDLASRSTERPPRSFAISSRDSHLAPSEELATDRTLLSAAGKFVLVMQGAGCKLVIYDTATKGPIWSSTENPGEGCRAVLTPNGRLVIHDSNGVERWSRSPGGDGRSRFAELQDDGNLVLRDAWWRALWYSFQETPAP